MERDEIIRGRFEKVNAEYQNYSGNKIYAMPSKLRIETKLLAGQGRYEFDIKKTNIDNPFEVSLNRNDVFIPNHLGILIGLRSTTKPTTELLMSFPQYNDGVKPSPYDAGFQNKDIEALYNGSLQWLVDNGILIDSYPTENFKKVPRTQGAFILDSNDAAVNELVQPNWDIRKACDFLIPKYTLAGTRDHRVTVNFGASGLTFPVTTGYDAYLVLYADGFLVKGGCEWFDKANPNGGAVGQW